MRCSCCKEEYDEKLFENCPYCNTSSKESIGKETENNLLDNGSEDSIVSGYDNDKNLLEANNPTQDNVLDMPISKFFVEDRFNLFLIYCNKHNLINMRDLNGFDFDLLSYQKGIGPKKIEDIRALYSNVTGIITKSRNEEIEEINDNGPSIKNMFMNINGELEQLDINFLLFVGFKKKHCKALVRAGLTKFKDLKGILNDKLLKIVSEVEPAFLEEAEKVLCLDLVDFIRFSMSLQKNSIDYEIFCKRNQGYTLQEIGDENNLTRERIRQKVKGFLNYFDDLFEYIFKSMYKEKLVIFVEELTDTFSEEYSEIIISWAGINKNVVYLDFASAIINNNAKSALEIENNILDIVTSTFDDVLCISETAENIDELLKENGYSFINLDSVLSLLLKHGYKLYGDYVLKTKPTYSFLASLAVEKYFPNGIKLYGEHDLALLREYTRKEFGDIAATEGDRSLSTRLAKKLVLRDRGAYISPEHIFVERKTLQEIKKYIDDSDEREIYYVELYNKFSGILNVSSNIDNPYFLHGVLNLFYYDEYGFSNRDYMTNYSRGSRSVTLADKIKSYILEKNRPVSKTEIITNFGNFSDMLLYTLCEEDDELFIWNFNMYYVTSLVNTSEDEKFKLILSIQKNIDKYSGYCSDNLLMDEVKLLLPEWIQKNNIHSANNVYYYCQKMFSLFYDFRRPHICKKDMLPNITTKNIYLHFNGEDNISYESYTKMAKNFKWADATLYMVFRDMEREYFRVDFDRYVKKGKVLLNELDIKKIKELVQNHMTDGYLTLINFDEWEEFPDIGYNWNSYLLDSIVEEYLTEFKRIYTKITDRRYVRTTIIDNSSDINDYVDLVVYILKKQQIRELSEGKMLSFLIINNLTRKVVPKELYESDKIIYKKETFYIL